MKKVFITGSSGLIGSEAALFFEKRGWETHGVDNNMRRDFLGADGDTTWNLKRLRQITKHFTHHDLDIRNLPAILELVRKVRPQLIIHCAAQPSHDLAKDRPFDDFGINAVGTLNLLEAVHQYCPESPYIFMSTNKVYGTAPNEKPFVELESRWDYADPVDDHGINETCRIDASLHSPFGVSKLAADMMVQEYGRYFNMPSVCLRAGCVTGPYHAGAELHGFLAYMARAMREGRTYTIYGYKGKQVRDNIHCHDVCAFFEAFYHRPGVAAVYNIGGGRRNSVSVVEAIHRFKERMGRQIKSNYVDRHRVGDHICYISDLRRIETDYPEWRIECSLDHIFEELSDETLCRYPCP